MKHVKRVLFFILGICIAFSLFAVTAISAGAQSREGESTGSKCYTVTNAGDGFSLIPNEGEPTFGTSLNDILSGLRDNTGIVEIQFRDVSADEQIDIGAGNYVISGGLSVRKITVYQGASLTLTGAEISLSGDVEIRGGALTVTESSLRSEGCAVTLNHLSTSTLTLESGEIIGGERGPAIRITKGGAYIKGGRVKCAAGVAVENESSLTVSGSPEIIGASYDVVSSDELFLYDGGESFSGNLRVKFMKDFADGTLTPLLYGEAASADGLTVYDIRGAAAELTYFDSYPGRVDESFYGVYRPYTVTYVAGNEKIGEKKFLSGEIPEITEIPQREGYTPRGWFLDGAFENEYDFASCLGGSVTLYAGYALDLPSYKLAGYSGEYDGNSHTVGFESITHTAPGGIYSFLWLDSEGREVSRAMSFKVGTVSSSGEYKCKVTYTLGVDFVEFDAPSITVSIRRAVLTPPNLPSVYYNGRSQYPAIPPSGLYTYSTEGFVSCGCYSVTLLLADPENYCWGGSEGISAEVKFEILQASNEWISTPMASDSYLGEEITAAAASLFGDVYFLFSADPDSGYSSDIPTSAGLYYMIGVVDETSDYRGLISLPQTFFILPHTPVALEVTDPPKRSEYAAFDLFDPLGMSVTVIYDSGKRGIISPSELRVIYQSGERFLYGDNGVVLEYGGVRLTYPVRVVKADYPDIPALSDAEAVFDGKFHSLSLGKAMPAGLDGIVPTYTVSGGGTDAGSYTVKITFATESKNYNPPREMTAILTVLPRETAIIIDTSSFVYDGTPKIPTGYIVDIWGAKVPVEISGAAIRAGDYTAKVRSTDPNYSLSVNEIAFTIAKADYDMSGVRWVREQFVYDGNQKSVYLVGLPSAVRDVGYVGATATDAGEYLATVSFEYDSINYNEPFIQALSWSVSPAEYDMGELEFFDAEYVYDGQPHYPKVTGDTPIGIDGIKLSYSFSGAVTNASVGEVRVIFSTESKNYRLPDPILCTVTVLPMGIYVSWGNVSFEYDGGAKLPRAKSEYGEIRVSGDGKNAGTYIAEAESVNPNYYVINNSVSFEITQAKNKWISYPAVSDSFEGRDVRVTAEAKWGEVELEFYLDSALTQRAEPPLASGNYYLVARVAPDDNYEGIESSVMSLKVIPIVAVGITAELKSGEIKAFQRIEAGDFLLIVTNNDGSEYIADSSLVSVFGDGKELYAGERELVFSYLDFTVTLKIPVSRADYDMSNVRWTDTDTVYDGEVKNPTLSGLPEGVSVLRYTLAGAVNAGEYSLGANLSYDSENYNPPLIPAGILTINKKMISPEPILTVVYNGEIRTPAVDNPYYRLNGSYGFKDAGVYTVELVLSDPANFSFEGEGSVEFVILPATLSVKVADSDKYLFGNVDEPEYTLLGSVVSGDDPKIRVYREGDVFTAVAENPNYLLDVEAGRIVKHFYPSPRFMGILYSVIALVLIVLIAALVLMRFRGRFVLLLFGRGKERPAPPSVQSLPDENVTREVSPRVSEPQESEIDSESDTLPMDRGRADELITDTMAKTLLYRGGDVIVTWGKRRSVVNIDTLGEVFPAGATVDINRMKKKGIIPADSGRVKVLARGTLDKPLRIKANEFSLTAVKMIALTGGVAEKTPTFIRRTAKIPRKK